MDTQEKRLYKSESNKVIGGVCGGLGEYFGIDPVIFRIIAVVLIFAHGAGLLIYLIAWICMPKRQAQAYPNGQYYGNEQYYQQPGPQQNRPQDTTVGNEYK